MYTVRQLGDLAGVSARTLRYYDEIGLLKPAYVSEAGYRMYGAREVDLLQQILFYRALGFRLDEVREIVLNPDFDAVAAMKAHREQLYEKRRELDVLLRNVNETIASYEGGIAMKDEAKFEGLKKRLVAENEKMYGEEIRKKYGDEAVDAANAKVQGMSEAEYAEASKLGQDVLEKLVAALAQGDPAGDLAQEVAALHHKWLMYYWKVYNPQAHAGLAQMYVDDVRFRAHYEVVPGATEFLRDAVHVYTKRK